MSSYLIFTLDSRSYGAKNLLYIDRQVLCVCVSVRVYYITLLHSVAHRP